MKRERVLARQARGSFAICEHDFAKNNHMTKSAAKTIDEPVFPLADRTPPLHRFARVDPEGVSELRDVPNRKSHKGSRHITGAARKAGTDVPGTEVLSAMHRRLTFFGVNVDLLSLQEVVAIAEKSMQFRMPVRHTALNVAKLVNLANSAELAVDVNSSDIVGIDGMGIVYGLRLFGQRGVDRVAGIDLFYALLDHCARTGRKPFILGSTQSNLERAMEEARRRYPGLTFAGSRNGYFTAEERPKVVQQIASSGADCLFVAMPTPHKERFLNAHAAELGVPFMMGVGGSVDVLAGHVSRAPLWMQNSGLEWLHRLLQEPRKMFPRYSRTNALYAVMLARSLLTGTNPVQPLAATASDSPR